MIKFLFGQWCHMCGAGWRTRRWSRYDGTGSWRMHERGHFPDTDESFFCERNGWFSRHWFATTVILGVPAFATLMVLADQIGR